jgi:predicted ATP-grasp superfamily ATP-dependent carboligase
MSNQALRRKYAGQPVVVLGLARNGASVLRRLKTLGFRCFGIDHQPGEPGWHVGGVQRRACPNPEENFDAWLAFMVEFATEFAEAPPLIPTTDVYVVALDQAASRLPNKFRMHNFGSGLRAELTAKRTTFAYAEQAGLPRPSTEFVSTREALEAFLARTSGPVLIKPDLPQSWRSGAAAKLAAGRKVMTGRDQELLQEYDRIAEFCPDVVAQEIIPGSDDRLTYWCGFVGPEGRVGGRFIGRKHRISPINYGSATYVRLNNLPELEERCEQFLVSLGYVGLCGIEFKEDPRDGQFKLIEVNPRYSLWDDIGIPVGVDLVQEAITSLLGETTIPRRPTHTRQKWVELLRDIGSFRQYRRRNLLTTYQWLRSLTPPIIVNDLPVRQNPRYAMHMIWRQVAKLAGLR